jgi:hypothetical protein
LHQLIDAIRTDSQGHLLPMRQYSLRNGLTWLLVKEGEMQTLTLSLLSMAGCCLLLMPGMVLAKVRIQTQFLQFPKFPHCHIPPQVQHTPATASISVISAYEGADREPRLIVDAAKKQQNVVQNSPPAAAIAYNTNPVEPESRGKQPGL